MPDEYPFEPNARRLASELSMLLTVSRFFSSLQATMLQDERALSVDLEEVYRLLEILKAGPSEIEPEALREIIHKVNQARVEIAMLDHALPPSVFRRFFERVATFDRVMLQRIVHYYLRKTPKDDPDRDKLDLLATRLCTYTTQNDQGTKVMACLNEADKLLEEIYPSTESPEPPGQTEEATLNTLRRLARSITEVRNFNALIDGKLVTKLRQCKIELGDAFYMLAVLKEIIRINVAVHNKFQELYGQEQARLRMESARLMRSSMSTGRHVAAGDKPQHHPTLSQMTELTLHMQRLIQDFKQEIAARALNDRQTRVNLEEDGRGLSALVLNVEDALRRAREMMEEIQGRMLKLSNPEEQ